MIAIVLLLNNEVNIIVSYEIIHSTSDQLASILLLLLLFYISIGK